MQIQRFTIAYIKGYCVTCQNIAGCKIFVVVVGPHPDGSSSSVNEVFPVDNIR